MYLHAVIIFIISSFLIYIPALILGLTVDYADAVANQSTYKLYCKLISYLISFLTLGFIGNFLYLKKAHRIVTNFISHKEIENLTANDLNSLREKGGVDIRTIIIIVIIVIVANFVYAAFHIAR